jgi:hypothetical protein
LYTCWSWLISFSMIIWFKTLFDLIQATIQGVTWLKANLQADCVSIRTAHWHCCSDMFTFNLATICCSQGLNFTLFFKSEWIRKTSFWVSIHTHCCNELL